MFSIVIAIKTWTYYLLVTKAFHSRTPQQISKAHVKTHEHCFTNLGVRHIVEDSSYTSYKQMLVFICRFSLLRLMRFVHFNANWLDFVFVGAKLKIFPFAQGKSGKKRWIFL